MAWSLISKSAERRPSSQVPWLLLGSRGSLQIDAKNQCHLRYFDAKKLAKLKASDGTPTGRSGSHFSGGEEIPWLEENFQAAPKKPVSFWIELYRTLRKGAKFPVTLEQARENIRIITLAKKGTGF